jgi:hypothetical protein
MPLGRDVNAASGRVYVEFRSRGLDRVTAARVTRAFRMAS